LSSVLIPNYLSRRSTFSDRDSKGTHQATRSQGGGEAACLAGTPHAQERPPGSHEGGAVDNTHIHNHEDAAANLGNRED
jgi:hypothetical protein